MSVDRCRQLPAGLLILSFVLVVAAGGAATAGAPDEQVARTIEQLQEATGGTAAVSLNSATRVARLVTFEPGRLALAGDGSKQRSTRQLSLDFFERFGGLFGIDDARRELSFTSTTTDRLGATRVEYRQMQGAVPVFAATLRAHFDPQGRLRAVNGTFVPGLSLSLTPVLDADAAARAALARVGTERGHRTALDVPGATLYVYRTNLTRGVPGTDHLVYEVEVGDGAGVREWVYVDAHKGHVVDRINAIHEGIQRRIYEGGFGESYLTWSDGDAQPFGDEDIDHLIDYAEDTYNLFASMSGGSYLSWDGADGILHSVNNNPAIACPNANWNGTSTNFCPGVTADDTVAHEWAHAYTSATHDLIYQWQPGALNEAYSDIWGETVDLLNGEGTDQPDLPRTAGACTTLGGSPPPRFEVDSPAAIAGIFASAGAGFGPGGPLEVRAALERVNDGFGDTADGCGAPIGFTPGRIALIDRGSCAFTTKVLNAQNAGAAAVVVVNIDDDGVFNMGGTEASISIPTVMIGRTSGETIEAWLDGGVQATLALDEPSDASVRWLSSEDSVAFGRPIRDMWNPTCFHDPGKLTDPEYHCGSSDSGGVHINSGVPNHAFALLVDGGTYNGETVGAIGLTRAGHIYWRAQTVYQSRASDFADHADLLELSCADLIGAPLLELNTDSPTPIPSAETISVDDCAELSSAIRAVELRSEPSQCHFTPMFDPAVPALCEGVGATIPIGLIDWESGLNGWTVGRRELADPATFDTPDWAVVDVLPDGRAGRAAFVQDLRAGDCAADTEAGILWLESPDIALPTGTGPPRVAFEHWVATELRWDGGNLRLNRNGESWQLVPGEAFTFNGYPDTLNAGSDNPLTGQPAFTGADEGDVTGSWGQSQVNLAGLAWPGDTVRLRFEFGLDGCNGVIGWYVDDVQVYACACEDEDDPANLMIWFPDGDGDGVGVPGDTVAGCAQPEGFAGRTDDCDDADASRSPALDEACDDGVDNDCDPTTPDVFDIDADGHSCIVDCNDVDGTAWAPPGEAANLRFEDKQTLTWELPQEYGGAVVVSDTLRSAAAADFATAVCAETDGADTVTVDPDLPPPGVAWHYLVYAENGCPGSGPLGQTSSGTPRTTPGCN